MTGGRALAEMLLQGDTIGLAVLREDGTVVAPPDLKRWGSMLELLGDWAQAEDILRTIEPKDPSLAVTQEMVTAFNTNCVGPIRKNSIEHNYYFMNQHSYAVMGYLASAILGDEVEDYKQAVEWTTVNATTPNQGRNGSIKQQIRMVTRNDKTGEAVEPNLHGAIRRAVL